ncbi:MAG: glycosyltransferase family 2 protein [Bacteroidota bacterium]
MDHPNSEDDTEQLIAQLDDPKIRVIHTVWDDSLREGGRVLAVETDKALAAISPKADWAIYIQGDEVMHEAGHAEVRMAMERWQSDDRVEGLLFNYRHFYGSYDYVGDSYQWYRKEIRVIKPHADVYSFQDAIGFRRGDNQKLQVKPLKAHIHHYGWVREPAAMQGKQENFNKLWHDDAWMDKHVVKAEEYDYSGIDSLERYSGTHPAVMQPRIERMNWQFDHDLSHNSLHLKDRFRRWVEKRTGVVLWKHKNYRIVR